MDPKLRAVLRAQRVAATAATEQMMDLILGEAQRLAPIDEGTLRGSATRETRITTTGAEVTGSFPLPYAEVQHEHSEYVHPRGGQSHYLEQPVKRVAHKLPRVIGAAIAKVT